ncbi:DUF4192 domain-containing protein [Thermomonospora umbrina]|uniref:Uncharacterized protein DUF4192 n=1 Tax=Thermomonospora umbrina TaxID=111806 RepID=A0A3D9SM99_9ACTN|nr:DUF4192 domain-containing protein [Thermomonospora umbrina]REE95530.1 uncharacterized protein DUF4192 [Thermomonospora umbrina]
MDKPLTDPGAVTLTIRSPQDAIAAAPYIFGFHPAQSLVVLGFGGPSNLCAMRLDLPRPGSAAGRRDTTERLSALLTRNGCRQALLLGYGSPEQVTPLIDGARRVLAALGITVKDALRVHEGRWWSYLCTDPACCSPEGVPYDISSTVVAAEATLAGHVVYADRSELKDSIAPLDGPARRSMQEATRRAQARLLSWAATDPAPAEIQSHMLQEAVPLITDLTTRASHGADPPTDDEIAWLSLLLTNLRIRDEAWVRIDPDDPKPSVAFWRDVLRRVEAPYTPAPACLLAYAAYAAGDGSLANLALDRAAEADPTYTLTLLLREVLHAGIPPSKARLNMTPEDLSLAHSDQDPAPP